MIKAVIFDYGNVISSLHNDRFIENIAQYSGSTVAGLHELVNTGKGLPREYELGLITSDEFFQRAVKLGDLKITKNDFLELFTSRFSPVRETRELIRSLKRNYKLGLLSNTNEWDFEYEIQKCDVFTLFDTVTLSYKIGAMKPDSKIYHDALNGLDVSPGECVYIDDISEYSEAACKIGIRGIHYTTYENLLESLRGLQVKE